MRADGARRTVMLLDAVAGGQAGEVMALHGAGGSSALGSSDDVHGCNVLEDFSGSEYSAHFDVRGLLQAEFANVALRLAIGLGRQGNAGGRTRSAPLRFQIGGNVAAFGARGLAAVLVFGV